MPILILWDVEVIIGNIVTPASVEQVFEHVEAPPVGQRQQQLVNSIDYVGHVFNLFQFVPPHH